MASAPRLDFPGAFQHVMARGIDRTAIFRDDQDREDFLTRLGQALHDTGGLAHAWALQPNHVHLFLQSGVFGLSRLMRKLLGGYARAFNRRHGRVGHLFQGRFCSILVEAESYFLELVRYIHLNPLRARVVRDLDELASFPWTGHATILGTRDRPWQTTATVLGQFGGERSVAMQRYLLFVAEGQGLARQPELELGRLVRRTADGVSLENEHRRGRERWCEDERVLGSDTFVASVAFQLGLGRLQSGRARALTEQQLVDLLGRVAEEHAIDVGEIRAGSQRRAVVRARSSFCHRACRQIGTPVAEVARYLALTPRAVRYLAERSYELRRTMQPRQSSAG